MSTDVILTADNGYYDIEWTDGGDIRTDQALDSFILLCLFGEARATAGEVPASHMRRGWLGNEFTPDFQQGSKAWLFSQERATATTLAELGPVLRNSLQPLIDEGMATAVSVETPFLQRGRVVVYINVERPGSKTERRFYDLWDNTGASF